MKYTNFIFQMDRAGDACVHYLTANSKREKYVVGTLDLSTAYIAAKLGKLTNLKVPDETEAPEGSCLMFCWDTDSFRVINIAQVTSVTPLNELIALAG